MRERVVWVLGAGFSVPLGGPMLKDLLSLESRRDIEEKHPRSDDPAYSTNKIPVWGLDGASPRAQVNCPGAAATARGVAHKRRFPS